MGDWIDPLNDPRFPDRPTHPDYWRLAEAVMRLDGAATEGGQSMTEIMATLVDVPSLTYMVRQRAGMLLDALKMDHRLMSLVEASMLTGVITGIEFQVAGGKQ